jgi:hypothetical protein
MLVHLDSIRLTHRIQAVSYNLMSNGSCEMTSKAIDYVAHYFKVANKGVSALY